MPTTLDWKEITKDSYNKHADQFALHTTGYRGKMAAWIAEFALQFDQNAAILDLGCGAGRDAKYFTGKGLQVTGIDFSEELIKVAQQKVPRAKLLVMDFEDLLFPKNSFDGIWASASLYHIPKSKLLAILKKCHTILKDNGYFFACIRMGVGEKITEEKRGNAMLKRFAAYYQPDELVQYYHNAGFKNTTYELDTIDSGDWIGVFAKR